MQYSEKPTKLCDLINKVRPVPVRKRHPIELQPEPDSRPTRNRKPFDLRRMTEEVAHEFAGNGQ